MRMPYYRITHHFPQGIVDGKYDNLMKVEGNPPWGYNSRAIRRLCSNCVPPQEDGQVASCRVTSPP